MNEDQLEIVRYLRKGEPYTMIILRESRELLSDTPSRLSALMESAIDLSMQVFEGDRMLRMTGVEEFRTEANKRLATLLRGSPSVKEVIEFAEVLRREAVALLSDARSQYLNTGLEPRARRDTPNRSAAEKIHISTFFDLNAECSLPGCQELREEWKVVYEEAGGDDCPGCVMGNLRRQFEERVIELINAASG